MKPIEHLLLYTQLHLTPIPLKHRSKEPLVKWTSRDWNPTWADLQRWSAKDGINWGVRCGPELVVLDFDDPADFHAFMASHHLPPGTPIVKTGRGNHIWLKPVRPVRSRYLKGVEVKGSGSYVVAPGSTHSNGTAYTFLKPPGNALPQIDIEKLLGLPPQKKQRANRPTHAPTTQQQKEFLAMMASLGVVPGENPTWCPFHPDEHLDGKRSLSVDFTLCLFNCFAPRCGVGGGIGTLSRLGGRGSDASDENRRSDKKSEQIRLAKALIDSRLDEVAEQVEACREKFHVYKCKGCGSLPSFPFSCGFQLCPACLGTRFASFWEKHEATLDTSLVLLQLDPGVALPLERNSIAKIRERFSEWRNRRELEAGLYGMSVLAEDGRCRIDILLVLPISELEKIGASRAFKVEVVAAAADQEQARNWLIATLLEGVSSWSTPSEMLGLAEMLKGSPRVFGFGFWHQVRGGRGATKEERKAPTCPFCGGNLRYLGLAPAERMFSEGGHAVYRAPP